MSLIRQPKHPVHAAYVLLSLTALFWAGNAIVARGFHETVGPLTLAFLRWGAASVLVLPLAWPWLRRDRDLLVAAWPRVLVLALLGISAFNSLLYHAAHSTTATNIALIQTAMPAMIVLFGAVFFGDPVGPRRAAGVGLSMLGAAVVVLGGDGRALLEGELAAGDLWMLLAVADYALYSVLLRHRPPVHPLALVGATFIVGTAVLLPLFLWEAAVRGLPPASPGLVAAVGYVAVFPSVLSYLFWNRGVELIGSGRAGFFICLIPVFTALLAALFLGERLELYHFAGLLIIVAGFVLFSRPGKGA